MSTIWQGAEFTNPAEFTGFDVEALDGSIGKVEEATLGTDIDYLVVDTGPWIFGKKVLIPAGFIDIIDLDDRSVHLGLTRDEIEQGPEYDEERHSPSAEEPFWEPYDEYYGPFGGTPMG